MQTPSLDKLLRSVSENNRLSESKLHSQLRQEQNKLLTGKRKIESMIRSFETKR